MTIPARWIAVLAVALCPYQVAIEAAPRGPESEPSVETWQLAMVVRASDDGPKSPSSHLPRAFRAYRLRLSGVKDTLARSSPTEAAIALPLPDGRLRRFVATPTSFMAPPMAAKYPEIQTYRLRSVETPWIHGAINVSPAGVHAALLTPEGVVKIQRRTIDGQVLHLSYFERDAPDAGGNCGVQDPAPRAESTTADVREVATPGRAAAHLGAAGETAVSTPAMGDAVTLKKYDLAIATTYEFFTAIADPADPNALDEVVLVVDNLVLDLNVIFWRDLAAELVLVPGTDELFFDNPGDPFNNDLCPCADQGVPLEYQAMMVLNNAVSAGTIPSFDVGHLLAGPETGDCTYTGCGYPRVVCTGQAGRGATKNGDPTEPNARLIAHELGHQFGANHTWSSQICEEKYGGFPSGSAVEPGGGSTEMGYQTCSGPGGNENIDATEAERSYFHSWSIDEIQAYLATRSCESATVSTNLSPVIESLPDCQCCNSYYPCVKIPPETGFTLDASVSDDGGTEELIYTWEQIDVAPESSSPLIDDGPGDPIFRSFFPGTASARTFEDKAIPGEILPTTFRDINMRLVARDNVVPYGGVSYGRMQLKVVGAPLAVTSPNGGEQITQSFVSVEWSPGATTTGELGHVVDEVNILFSADAGESWELLTAEPTANDGQQEVQLNLCPTTFDGLIKVQGTDSLALSDTSDATFRVYCPCPEAGTCNGEVCDCEQVDTGRENCWTGTELAWCYPGTTIELNRCTCDTSIGGGGGIGGIQTCTGLQFTESWGCPGVVDCPTVSPCDPCGPVPSSCSPIDLQIDACRREDFTLMACEPGQTIHIIECDCIDSPLCPETGESLRCM